MLVVVVIAVGVLFAGTFSVRGSLVQLLHRSARLRSAQADLQSVLVLRSDETADVEARGATATSRRRELRRLSAGLHSSVRDLTANLAALEMPRSLAAARALGADVDTWASTVRRATITPADASLNATLRRRILQDVGEIESRLNSEGAAAEQRTEHDADRTIALATLASVVVVGFALVAIRRRAAYTAQKNVADALRRAFDPTTLPDTKSIRFSAKSLPAAHNAQVGGDWCDAYVLPDGRVFFSIGDVAGHGLGAAVGMSRVRQSLLAASLSQNDPSAVFTTVNAVIHVQRAGLVTAICGFVDPIARTVAYACAGHPPPIVVDGGEVRLLPYGDVPLGVDVTAKYTTQTLHAGDGTTLILYTDGIVEYQRDAVAGEQRLLRVARECTELRPTATAEDMLGRLIPNGSLSDDASVMLIAFRSARSLGSTPSTPS